MSVEKLANASIYYGSKASSTERLNSRQEENEKFNGKSVNASNLDFMQDDVTEKKIKANKEALKTKLATFTSQLSIDDQVSSMRDKIDEIRQKIQDTEQQKNEADTNQEALLERYGIDKNSQEYKDFELLAKQQNYSKRKIDGLSAEEKDRLANMGEQTDFQKQALFNANVADESEHNINEYEKELMGLVGAVKGINQELLKSDPMVGAAKIAEDIIKSANKEVIGMLIEEAKDHIDETREEEAKEAEEAQKEKEELEARIEAAKPDEEKEANKDILDLNGDVINTQGFAKADEVQQKIENELKLMLLKQKITNDDAKGIAVDEQR